MPDTLIKIGVDTVNATDVTMPANRDFRDAWQLSGTVIDVDMNAARDIQRERIRTERIIAFEANDIALRDAVLSADATAQITYTARRDALRDAPASALITSAATPDALATINLAAIAP